MKVDASDEQVTAVRDLLDASSDVESFSFDDRDAAYQEFSRIFSCNPDLVDSISPQDLPESFRIVAAAPETVAALRAALIGEVGVDSISTGADAAREPTRPNAGCAPQGP
jgi:cell division transport system permease protein